MDIPTLEDNYLCKFCGKTFKWKKSFQQHLRIHGEFRPFVCTFCSKGFCKHSHLKEHIRIHTGDRPFKCKLCDYCGIQSGHLKQHYVTKHEKEYNKVLN